MSSATLSIEEAASSAWDVLVIGAGPAGALAARESARRGLRTLLVDRTAFPRAKVCGGCLSARALGVMERAGLGGLVGSLGGRPLESLALYSGARAAHLQLPGGMALSRGTFDAALVREAIYDGANFLEQIAAQIGACANDTREVILSHGAAKAGRKSLARARVVLDARGLSGHATITKASRLGAGALLDASASSYAPGSVHMACGRGGYVGLARAEDQTLLAAAAFDPKFVEESGGLGQAARTTLSENNLPLPPDILAASWRGTPLLTRRATTVAAPRLLVLGDAAGYVEPFTGEGMATALEAAEAVAARVEQGMQTWSSFIERDWARRQRGVERSQRLCHGVALLLRYPLATRGVVEALACMPALASPFILWAQRAKLSPSGPRDKAASA